MHIPVLGEKEFVDVIMKPDRIYDVTEKQSPQWYEYIQTKHIFLKEVEMDHTDILWQCKCGDQSTTAEAESEVGIPLKTI